jgi:hypothetical protein
MNISSKWIKEHNIKSKTLQLVHQRVGNTLEAIGIPKDFLSRKNSSSPEAKRKDGQMVLYEVKKLLHNKRNGL